MSTDAVTAARSAARESLRVQVESEQQAGILLEDDSAPTTAITVSSPISPLKNSSSHPTPQTSSISRNSSRGVTPNAGGKSPGRIGNRHRLMTEGNLTVNIEELSSDLAYHPNAESLRYIFQQTASPAVSFMEPEKNMNRVVVSRPGMASPKESDPKAAAKKKKKAAHMRKASCIADFGRKATRGTISGDGKQAAMEAVMREVEFLSREVPQFQNIYETAKSTFQDKKSNNHVAVSLELVVIESLSRWIREHGAHAVTEFNEFKSDTEMEITAMVEKIESLTGDNQQLAVVCDSMQRDNDDLESELKKKEDLLARKTKLESDNPLGGEGGGTRELEIALDESERQCTFLAEKNEELEKNYQFLQQDFQNVLELSDDKDDELTILKRELGSVKHKLKAAEQRHEKEIGLLQSKQSGLEEQMMTERQKQEAHAREQEELMQQLAAADDVGAHRMESFDTPVASGSGVTENDDGMADGTLFTLDSEMGDYLGGYLDEDGWLSDSGTYGDLTPQAPMEFEAERTSFSVEPAPSPVFEEQRVSMQEKHVAANLLTLSTTYESRNSVNAATAGNFGAAHTAHGEEQDPGWTDSKLSYEQKQIKKKIIPPKFKKAEPEKKTYTGGIESRGLNFKKLMGGWAKTEQEKGGKPVAKDEYFATIAKQNREVTIAKWRPRNSSKGVVKASVNAPGKALHRMEIKTLNVTAKRHRLLKPRMAGYLEVVNCPIIPEAILLRHTDKRFYFCLDGLPMGTNLKTTEPDYAKDRSNDPLCPSLFFFDNEQSYRQLVREVGGVPVREQKFQIAFAKHCRGLLMLQTRSVDTTQEKCYEHLSKRNRRQFTLPRHLESEPKDPELSLFVVGPGESHQFLAVDPTARAKWMGKIGRLFDKAVDHQTKNRKMSTVYADPIGGALPTRNHKLSIIADKKLTLSEADEQMD